jgi:glycosyltransferase involved in cell wall biosynthesis
MKIAVLSLMDPWAETHGGTLRTRAFLDAFAAVGSDVVCVFPGQYPVVEPVVGRSVAAGSQPLGSRPMPAWIRGAKRAVLPMPTMFGARLRALAQAVADERPDVLHVPSVAQAAYADVVPDARLWFDMSDLLSEFAAREAASRRLLARLLAERQRGQIVRTEALYVSRAAVVSAAGWTDAELISTRSGKPTEWLPTPVGVRQHPTTTAAAGVAGFIANFEFTPNIDAWHVLVSRWLPGLRARGWRVVVAGLRSDSLPATEGVELLGPVRDVDDFYDRVSVTLAPIRLGGGMKVKVAESLLAGRPVIASAFAVDGFPPAIRAATTVVDVEQPDWSVISDGPPAIPASALAELSVFRAESFRHRVEQLLSGLA